MTVPTYDELVAARAPALLRLAVMLTGSVDEAEELLQRTFLRAQRHAERIAAMAAPAAYLRQVMLNEHLPAFGCSAAGRERTATPGSTRSRLPTSTATTPRRARSQGSGTASTFLPTGCTTGWCSTPRQETSGQTRPGRARKPSSSRVMACVSNQLWRRAGTSTNSSVSWLVTESQRQSDQMPRS